MQSLFVNEIFYSLQGEGARAGEASIFIRLSGCNLKCDFCDTEHNSVKREMTLMEIANAISQYTSKWIIWTGGEPTLQLNETITDFFSTIGYKQAIETNGTKPIPKGIRYIACSPKCKIDDSIESVNEIRFVINEIGAKPNLEFLNYCDYNDLYISPKFDGLELNNELLKYCVNLCLENPKWKLSVQQHKMLKIQ